MSVGFPASVKLNQWAFFVRQAFCADVYQVGSSIREKNTRDVDVVALVSQKDWDRLFPGENPGHGELNPRWSAFCCAFSVWGKEFTGLNIDFKVQPAAWANEHKKGARSSLGRLSGYKGATIDDSWIDDKVKPSKN